MYPDLIARTCGYLGVFIALIVMGIWGEPEFAVTPQQSFDRIALSLHVLEPEAPTPDQSQEPAEPEEAVEPVPEPEPIPQPEETPAPEPAEPEEIPAPEPFPAPEAVTEPELTTPPTQVHTTPAEKPKAQPKAQEKPKPKAQAKPQQPRSTATTTTQNKAKLQAAAAKEAPTAKAPATTSDTSANLDRQLRSQLSSLLVREIRSHLKYPRNAVRRKLEGTVMMEFEVKNGVVVGFVLRQSSGHKILDEAARKLAQKLVQFNTRLGAMNYRVQIPIKYELL
ncbi:MAG TPA: TonB family protein [Candidatus Anaerobiospirillum pullistercoris]|uniref:TonB family protein n=1 Tax=Candidatus Anaerobiospirillum pullistercoris TaxID=2838452 RepID=A0A9D1WCK0_9GAMM|nr:TonB family protein [Candidatus Anaerobiospirillum pullistercoris]